MLRDVETLKLDVKNRGIVDSTEDAASALLMDVQIITLLVVFMVYVDLTD